MTVHMQYFWSLELEFCFVLFDQNLDSQVTSNKLATTSVKAINGCESEKIGISNPENSACISISVPFSLGDNLHRPCSAIQSSNCKFEPTRIPYSSSSEPKSLRLKCGAIIAFISPAVGTSEEVVDINVLRKALIRQVSFLRV